MSFVKDPAPGITPLDGTTIRTDQWAHLVDFIARTYPQSASVVKSGSTYYAYEGDGTFITSNTTASTVLQAAFDFLTAGGVLFVKAATYDIATTLSPLSNTVIIGEGDATILKAATNLNAAIFTLTSVTDVKFINLKIDGNRLNQTGTGDELCAVYTTNAAAAHVGLLNCTIVSTKGDGAHLFGESNYVHNCKIDDTGRRGVHCRGKYPQVIGCRISNTIETLADGIQFQIAGLCGGLIDSCTIKNTGAAGIDLHQVSPTGLEKVTISNCYIEDPISSYLEIDGAKSVSISNVTGHWSGAAGKCSNGGVRIDTISGTAVPSQITLSNCVIDGTRATSASGIQIVDGTFITVNDSVIVNCGDNGVVMSGTSANINIANNVIYNNKQFAVTGHGIEVASTVTDVMISGNRITTRHTDDINVAATDARIIITNNIVRTGELVMTMGASDVVRNNVGFVTENNGTGTISSGTTSATVTHGLAYTPAAGDINITLTEDPTNTPGAIYILTSEITSTTFIVRCENDPGASNLDFSWSVKR